METEISVEKLGVLSVRLNIPLWELKYAFGLPLSPDCEAITFAEAKQAFLAADPGEPRAAALFRWASLCETVNQIQEVHLNAGDYQAAMGHILRRWSGIINNALCSVDTLAGAMEFYHCAPRGSDSESAALRTAFKLFCKE